MIGRGRQLFVRCRATASAAPGFRTGAAAASSVATAENLLTAAATSGLLTNAAAATCAAALGLITDAAADTFAATLGLLAAAAANTCAAALSLLNAAAAVFDLHASVVAIFIAEAAFGLSAITIVTPGLPAVLTVPGLFSNLMLTRRSINRMVAVSISMWVAIVAAVR